MKTELICIGTELLTGKLNTNVVYIGERLSSVGLDLSLVTTVGDNKADMKTVFTDAINRSQIIIVTGGLGPTFDDLTREVVAEVLGKRLLLSREALSTIIQRFLKRNVDMPQNNERQAYVIEGAKVITNSNGTAPGQLIEIEKDKSKAILVLLPGPPNEMLSMFDESIFPYIKKFETRIKKTFTLHICGLAESLVDEKIKDIIDGEKKVDVGMVDFTILAHQMMVDIKTSVYGEDELMVDDIINHLKKEFYSVLGDNIYGEDKQTLESAVGNMLLKSKKTLSIAESCTGGLLSQKITNVSGSSIYFLEGIITYSNNAKVKVLGVKQETLNNFGAVSEETALEMAEGIKNLSGSDYAISITGIAGPGGGSPEKPVGLVYIGFIGPKIRQVYCFNFPGTRLEIRERAANYTLDLLRREMLF